MSSILDAVEGEAARLREDAREEARRYLDYSRRRADALVAERQRRISELSDDIMSKAEAVVGRLDDAAPVRAGFENLVRALGDTAERLSKEAERTRPEWEPAPFHDEAVAEHQPPPTYHPPPAYQPPADEQPGTPGTAASEPAPTVASSGAPGTGWTAPESGYETPPGPAFPAASAPQPPAQPPPSAAPTGAQPAMHQTTGSDAGTVDDARLVGIQMAASGRTRREVREHLHSVMGVADTQQLLDEIFGAGSAEDARVPWTAFPR